MLRLRILTNSLGSPISSAKQWMEITIRTSSPLSSNFSSDSSGNRENEGKIIPQRKKKVNDRPTEVLYNQKQTRNPVQRMNVAMERKPNVKNDRNEQGKDFGSLLRQAANIVANEISINKSDRSKALVELLEKLSSKNKQAAPKTMPPTSNILKDLLTNKTESSRTTTNGIINELLPEKKPVGQLHYDTPSIKPVEPSARKCIPLPEMKVWDKLEEKTLHTQNFPVNYFDELIQWTNEGKLWRFPIDNEQGLEKEQNVHFSEHIFMHRHLKGWCPKTGPIRHFMDLVCVGLSKNPYLSVEEKLDHINWYKEYFTEKQALLKDLGCMDSPQEKM